MNKEEAIEELKDIEGRLDDLLFASEVEALQYAIHFPESAEEVKQINNKL